MLSRLLLPAAAVGLAAVAAEAQAPRARALRVLRDDSPRAVIGISTSSSASARDTLGLLVTAITSKGPAEKAGLEEGNRIAAINGTSLRLAPSDVGDWEMQGIMQRRLTRELDKVKPGDEVELRVYAGGRFRTVRVKTEESESLYPDRQRVFRVSRDDRPTLGIGIGSTGSSRDTLGVFVMFVSDSGPAASAGIIEGNRIAAINGVDVRVSRVDAGDPEVGAAKARRLEREVSDLKPGDDAELRVWSNGQYRTVKVKVARASDLPHRRSSFIWMDGGGLGMVPPIPPMPPMPAMAPMPDVDVHISPEAITIPMRRAMEQAMETARRAMEDAGRAWAAPRVYEWDDEADDDGGAAVAPAAPGTRTLPTPAPARGRSAILRAASAADAWAPALAAASYGGTVTARPAVAWTDGSDDGATIVIDGLRLAPVNPELASYLGRGSERGALVLQAPAWTPDLRAGDVILSIDGRPVREGEGLSIAIDRSQPSTITYLRDGRRYETRVAR